MRFTAEMIPTFGVATVVRCAAGAFTAAKMLGRFKVATFSDTDDTVRNLVGAAMMGVGGVLALGCTIGQGVTGLSTLSIGSLLAFLSIITGGVVGVKSMERLLLRSA